MATDNTIFFSYSRDDSEFVLNLAKSLRKAGATIWLDQLDISPGSRWDSSIENALANSRTLLVILSCSSVKSNNVMDEVSYALEEQKRVVPVLMEQCDIPFRLRRLQYADFSGDHKTGVSTLIKALNLDENIAHKLADETIKDPQEAKQVKQEAIKTENISSTSTKKSGAPPKIENGPRQNPLVYPQTSSKKKSKWLVFGGIIIGVGLLVFIYFYFNTSVGDVKKTDEDGKAATVDSIFNNTGTEITEDTQVDGNDKNETPSINTGNGDGSIKTNGEPPVETISIEGQTWTAKNVDVKVGNYTCYNDDPYNCTENGALYTYEGAIAACKKLGPGWRLPNDFDWKLLTRAHGGATGDLTADEKSGKQAFRELVRGGNSNFKGALAGKKIYNTNNFYYYDYNRIGYYWSITRKKPHEDNEAIIYTFRIDDESLLRESMPITDYASCRCIKD